MLPVLEFYLQPFRLREAKCASGRRVKFAPPSRLPDRITGNRPALNPILLSAPYDPVRQREAQ
jgi:hypothetical protein